ncbi:MAG: D-alanyl-D-alanine carboxypeptidase [Clostridiales bacterium]|nr:D-alanyl-D-alanine carboxypeptidase [Clostridiales bacterium]
MRCTNNNQKRRISLLTAVCLGAVLLGGCGRGTELADAFAADLPGLGVQEQSTDMEISWFAEDLCVVDGNVEAIEADTAEALAACFFNLDTQEILYAKNVYDRLYPASTTKIMTALIALEKGDLDAQMTVSKEAITFSESGVSTVHLKEGDVLTLRQLLYALLLSSANDAANVIAEHVGGTSEEFVGMMNEEAARIGATGTHFVNPSGLHDEEHYTTAYDLYLIFQEALKNETFLEILKTVTYDTSYLAADGSAVEASWSNTNQFTKGDVTVPEGVTAAGGKTGTTMAARSCLVQLFEDAEGAQYVAIILGCKERAILYQEMQSFLSNLNN